MLLLLQQRTKLSGQIGAMKRRHGAVVYVPERERELLARLVRLGNGQLPAKAVAAMYREILSSSRAAQGQMPIGLLKASAAQVAPSSQGAFGACDQFSIQKSWAELAKGLGSGALSLALVTAGDLMGILKAPRWRKEFFKSLAVVGEISTASPIKESASEKVFIVTPRAAELSQAASRILILIECKSTVNAIKSVFHAMPDFSLHAEPLSRHGSLSLVRLTLDRPTDGIKATDRVLAAAKTAGLTASIFGVYPAAEVYGG